MRRPFADWHPETFLCSMEGHVTPAATVARLRPEDAGLGVDLPDGRRLVRCMRCDVWLAVHPPEDPVSESLPPLAEMEVPKRGRPLRDSIILKLIAIDRGVHAVIFALFAILLIYLDQHLGGLQRGAQDLLDAVRRALQDTGQAASRDFISRMLSQFLNLSKNTLLVLAGTAIVYAVVESIEAVGLWLEKRWAEYLTAIATAGFLPFEIRALIDRVTVLRVVALVINLAILLWLLWRKRLFGLNGGYQPHDADIDREALYGPPAAVLAPDAVPEAASRRG
jgi:uncharacterized membrane protein (DUF2068 family)